MSGGLSASTRPAVAVDVVGDEGGGLSISARSGFRVRAVALLVAAFAFAAAASPWGAAPAVSAEASFVVKSRFSPSLYLVAGSPETWGSTRNPRQYLDLGSWRALGSPAPAVWEPRYSSPPWSDTIYALTYWPDSDDRHDAHADPHVLTFDEWRSVGSPRPVKDFRACTDAKAMCRVFSRPSSLTEIFVAETAVHAPTHKLAYSEWVSMGRPLPDPTDRQLGVYRYSWSPILFWDVPENIGPVHHSTTNGHSDACGSRLGYAEWVREGSPTPQTISSSRASRFIQGPPRGFGYDDEIWYDGPAGFFRLTYAEWSGAGSPRPTPVSFTPFLPSSWTCTK